MGDHLVSLVENQNKEKQIIEKTATIQQDFKRLENWFQAEQYIIKEALFFMLTKFHPL